MHRRRLLRAATGLALGAVAGCVAPRSGRRTRTGAARTGQSGGAASVGDVDLPVPAGELRTAVARDQIPAIVDPAFASDWSGLDPPSHAERPLLPAEAPVVGIVREGWARAYPLRVLDWHEVVNDTLGGPLLVTYCPLCGSSVVAERTVNGAATVFGVSGKLWRGDLVLYDEATDSLWSQLLATAIRGPSTGEHLSLQTSRLTTWGQWRREHPDGEVLLPPPRSNTVRGREARFGYFGPKYVSDGRQVIGQGGGDSQGPGRRTLVLGIEHDGVARAYPFDAVEPVGAVEDRVGGLPVVVTVTPGGSMAGYVRRVDGERVSVSVAGPRHLRAAGSRWRRTTGRAVAGPHEGTRLPRATETPPMFWVGWSSFHPDTEVYGATRASDSGS